MEWNILEILLMNRIIRTALYINNNYNNIGGGEELSSIKIIILFV